MADGTVIFRGHLKKDLPTLFIFWENVMITSLHINFQNYMWNGIRLCSIENA